MATLSIGKIKELVFNPLKILKQEEEEKKIMSILPVWILYVEAISEVFGSVNDLIREISTRDQFSPITEIFDRISRLIREGVQTSTEAMRTVADEVSSEYFSKFLLRFAKALDVGQSVGEFITRERETILRDMREQHQFDLRRARTTVNLINSLNISLVFIFTSLILLSMIVGFNLSFIIVFFVVVILLTNILGNYRLRKILPRRTMIYVKEPGLKRKAILNAAVIMSLGFSIILVGRYLTLFIGGASPPLYFKGVLFLAFLPFFMPGYVGIKLERKVKELEPLYSSFMKNIAITARAKGAPLSQAILTSVPDIYEQVKVEYGLFAQYLWDLRKRIKNGVATQIAWQHLAEDTNSEIIRKSISIFVRPCYLGVNPLKVSKLTEKGMNLYLTFRERRNLLLSRYVWQIHVINATLIGILAFLQSVFQIIFGLVSGVPEITSLLVLNLQAMVLILEPLAIYLTGFLVIGGMFFIGFLKGGDRYSWFTHLAALCLEAAILLIVIPTFLPSLVHGLTAL